MAHRRLLGDSLRIRQVLTNLLSNAVKFTIKASYIAFLIVGVCLRGRRGRWIAGTWCGTQALLLDAVAIVTSLRLLGTPQCIDCLTGQHEAAQRLYDNGIDSGVTRALQGEVVVQVTIDDAPPALAPTSSDDAAPGAAAAAMDAGTPSDLVTVHMAVTDTGIGIPPDQRSLLFKGFTQGHGSSRSRSYGGTGAQLFRVAMFGSLSFAGTMAGRRYLCCAPRDQRHARLLA